MQELLGVTIDHYNLQRYLARGGMSEVYLALDTHTQHTVAIKLVHNSNSDYCERFKREVRTLATLSHDHILPAFAYGNYGDWCYLVMPYIEYGTLTNKLADGPLSLKDAGIILQQLSDALQYAHDRGIIHRDIKPTNVLLRDGEHVYLSDFGLVRQVGEDSELTGAGFLLGTPGYLAPELAEGPATTSSDLYALGVLLYQILTGHVPFTASTPMGIYLKHIQERPQAPSTINSAIPEIIDEVVLRALQKEPRHRYKTVREFVQAYWQAFYETENIPVLAIKQAPGKKTTLMINPTQALKPVQTFTLVVAAVIVFCVIPFAFGFTFSPDQDPIRQTPHTTKKVLSSSLIAPTSAPATPTPSSGPTAPANKSNTSPTIKMQAPIYFPPVTPSDPDQDNDDNGSWQDNGYWQDNGHRHDHRHGQ